VNHVPGLQIAAGGDDRLAWSTASDLTAFGHDGRSSGPVNGAIHSTPSNQTAVGGIHQGIRFLTGNVALNQG